MMFFKRRYKAQRPVFCGHCGAKLEKTLSGQNFNVRTGIPQSYYVVVRCPNRHYEDTHHTIFYWNESDISHEMYKEFDHASV